MHIARLRLKGFKSFGSEVCLEFGPHVNVIVGHNGSGKSNLVEAISVALSTTTLVPRTREMLLHDGARGTALIEVTINNDDGRLPGFGTNSNCLIVRNTTLLSAHSIAYCLVH
jgi:chromosome segregation ATPase